MELAPDPLALVEHAETAEFPLSPPIFERHGSLVGERSQEPNRFLVKDGAADGIGQGQRAERPALKDERDQYHRAHVAEGNHLLIGPTVRGGIGQDRWPTAFEDVAGDGSVCGNRQSDQLRGMRAVGHLDREGAGLPDGIRHDDGCGCGIDQLSGTPRDGLKDAFDLSAGQDRRTDLANRVQPLAMPSCLLVEPRVFDGDPGLRGEHDKRALVIGVELRSIPLLGEVDIPKDPPTGCHGRPQEGRHRRMVAWKSDMARIVGYASQPQRLGIPDEDPQDAFTNRQRPNRATLFRRDTGGDEIVEAAVRSEYTQRTVSRVRQLDRQLDEPLQHNWK